MWPLVVEHLYQLVGDASSSELLHHGEGHGAVIVDSGNGNQSAIVHHTEAHHPWRAESFDQLGVGDPAPSTCPACFRRVSGS